MDTTSKSDKVEKTSDMSATNNTVKCEFHGCKNVLDPQSTARTFFPFPVGTPYICQCWIRNSGNKQLEDLALEDLAKKYVCDVHFIDYYFPTKGDRSTLRKRAIPSRGFDIEEIRKRNITSTSIVRENAPPSNTTRQEKKEKKVVEKPKTTKPASNAVVMKKIKISKEELMSYVNFFPQTFASLADQSNGSIQTSSSGKGNSNKITLRFPGAAAVFDYKTCRSSLYRFRKLMTSNIEKNTSNVGDYTNDHNEDDNDDNNDDQDYTNYIEDCTSYDEDYINNSEENTLNINDNTSIAGKSTSNVENNSIFSEDNMNITEHSSSIAEGNTFNDEGNPSNAKTSNNNNDEKNGDDPNEDIKNEDTTESQENIM